MLIETIKRALYSFGLRLPDQAVLRDADELVRTWGVSAHTVAATLSWREDMGLVHAAEAGHWARVEREIGSRQGWQGDEPEADFAAEPDRRWADA